MQSLLLPHSMVVGLPRFKSWLAAGLSDPGVASAH